MKTVDKNKKVLKQIVKSNNLIESSYILTPPEQRLIYLASTKLKITMLDNNLTIEDVKQQIKQAQFDNIEISVSDYKKEFGIKSNRIYEELEETAKRLYDRSIIYLEGEKIVTKRWVITCKYDNQMGSIILQFHPDLIRDLLIFKSKYTILLLENTKDIKRSYTYRIYELLKQYEKFGVRTFTLEALRFVLGIEDEQYPRYGNLKQKVIVPAVKEINDNTDLYVEYEEIKQKRKVMGIKFRFIPQMVTFKKTTQLSMFDEDIPQGIRLLDKLYEILKIQVTAGQAETIITESTKAIDEYKLDISIIDYIKQKKAIADNYCKNREVDSYIGLLIDAIKKNYGLTYKNNSTFNDYNQRQYDFDKLEKQLLRY